MRPRSRFVRGRALAFVGLALGLARAPSAWAQDAAPAGPAAPSGPAAPGAPDSEPGAAQPAVASPPVCALPASAPAPPFFRVHVGAQAGLTFPVGLTWLGTFHAPSGKPRFDVDVTWEPSAYLQSYSVGGAYHIADSLFYVGPRVRLVQFHAPWSRGYRAAFDDHLGLGLEAGVRAPVGPEGRVLVLASLGGTLVPTAGSTMAGFLTLNAGVAWGAWDVGASR